MIIDILTINAYKRIVLMLGKFEILIVIIVLLLTFYFVISLGAGKGKSYDASHKIRKYLFGVRILIIIIAIVSLILWLLL